MVKEIVFTCDACADDRTPATHVALQVAVGKRKPKMLDLCDSHHDRLILPVLDALSDWGYTDAVPAKPAATSAPTSDQDGPYQCGLCPQQPKHIKSLRNHLRRVHSTTLAAYRAEHGDPVLVA